LFFGLIYYYLKLFSKEFIAELKFFEVIATLEVIEIITTFGVIASLDVTLQMLTSIGIVGA